MRCILIPLLCFFLLPFQSTCQPNKAKGSFIPMKVGNYWVYASDKQNKLDTVKIVEKIMIGSDSAYVYNTGAHWMEKNDSVYLFQTQRTRIEFPTLQYFPHEQYLEYSVIIGGDILGKRNVDKLKKPCAINGKTYTGCYQFEDTSRDGKKTVIISKGVGIIEIIDELSEPDLHWKLVEYHVQ